MKPRVYIETTIPSYLTARPSRDLVRAAHQQVTREWWDARHGFDLFVSEIVMSEAAGGDPEAAAKRLEAIAGIQFLRLDDHARVLARELVAAGPLPENAAIDALHVAVAVVNGMD